MSREGFRLRILMIEDDPDDVMIIHDALMETRSGTFTIHDVGSLQAGLRSVSESEYDVVLLDLNLPDSRGLSTLLTLVEKNHEIPIIVLSGVKDEEIAFEAVRRGAQDYLVKGEINARMLRRVLRYSTERFRLTRDLMAKEEHVRNILMSDPGGIVVLNAAGVIQFVNPAAAVLLAKQAEELVGQNFEFSFIKTQSFAEIVPLGSNQNRTIEVTTVDIQWDNLPAYLVTLRDLTEQKQAEQALRASEEKYRVLLESLDSVLATLDYEGRFLFMNEIAAQQLGGKREDFIGKTMFDLFPKSVAHDQVKVVREVFRHNRGLVAENLSMVQGKPHWYRTLLRPIHDSNGKVVSVLVNSIDIQEMKMAQQELRELNRDLDEHVKQRTAQLELTNQELEAFVYSVSHDLRNPLRKIVGLSKVLAEEYGARLDSLFASHLATIRESSFQMGELIQDLLNLSRASRGELLRTRVDLTEIARKIAADLHNQDLTRDVVFDIESKMIVIADPHLMAIALENLLNNAFKFSMRRTHGHIWVGKIEHEGEYHYFVRDDGIGFSMKDASKLFTPFHRLANGIEFPGTGIGLTTVQRVIARHGGKIWAEAIPDQGATFFFTLGDQVIDGE